MLVKKSSLLLKIFGLLNEQGKKIKEKTKEHKIEEEKRRVRKGRQVSRWSKIAGVKILSLIDNSFSPPRRTSTTKIENHNEIKRSNDPPHRKTTKIMISKNDK